MRAPEPAALTLWVEADEYARITSELAAELRERHPLAARQLDYRAQQYRMRRNQIAEDGR